MDNGHGLVTHSPQVPPYSTLFPISKLGIMIVSLSTSELLLTLLMIQSNRKDFRLCTFTTMIPWCINLLYVGLPTSTFPADHSIHTKSPLLLKASTHFPRIQTILSQPILSSPFKKNSNSWNGFTSMIQDLLAHCLVSTSYMS